MIFRSLILAGINRLLRVFWRPTPSVSDHKRSTQDGVDEEVVGANAGGKTLVPKDVAVGEEAGLDGQDDEDIAEDGQVADEVNKFVNDVEGSDVCLVINCKLRKKIRDIKEKILVVDNGECSVEMGTRFLVLKLTSYLVMILTNISFLL